MLPPPLSVLPIAFGIGIARGVVVGHPGIRRLQVAGVARVLLVPRPARAGHLAARVDHVGAIVEVERAAGGGAVVGRAGVALVDAGGRHQVGLAVAGQADLAGTVAAVVLGRGRFARLRHALLVARLRTIDALAAGTRRVAGPLRRGLPRADAAPGVGRRSVLVLARHPVAGLFLVGH